MNKEMLRSLMALHNENYSDLAKLLQITPQTVSDKINERKGAEFKQGEIAAIAKHYKMTDKQLIACFFAH